LHKGRLGREDDAQTSNTHKYMHSADKSRNTTLDDAKYDVRYKVTSSRQNYERQHIARRYRDSAL